jgi:hypothetical protein
MNPALQGMAATAVGSMFGMPGLGAAAGAGGMPSLGFSSSTSSKSGDIVAPNTVNFGGFGSGAGGGGLGSLTQYWPLLLGAAVLVAVLHKH